MSQQKDQLSSDFPLIAFQDVDGKLTSFYETLRKLSWKQASYNQVNQQYASYHEIMLFFVKVYALLAGILTTLYLMTFILLITKAQKLEKNENFHFHIGLYLGALMTTIVIGLLAYFFDKFRQFPLNIISYFTFTCGSAYVFGDPLSTVLSGGYYDGQDWIILLYLFTMTIGSYACLILFSFRRKTSLPLVSITFSIMGLMLFLLFIFLMTAPYYFGLLLASFFGHVIYGGLLIIDVQLIISGKLSLKLNQYVSGALYLYLDITVMVLYFTVCVLYALLKGLGYFLLTLLKALGYCCECCCKIIGSRGR